MTTNAAPKIKGPASYFPSIEKTYGEQVSHWMFVTYAARGAGGHRFRNTEIVTVRGAQIVEVEVYFGWDLPHKAAVGGYVSNPN